MNAQVTLMTTPDLPPPFPSNKHIHIFSLLHDTSKVQKMVKGLWNMFLSSQSNSSNLYNQVFPSAIN